MPDTKSIAYQAPGGVVYPLDDPNGPKVPPPPDDDSLTCTMSWRPHVRGVPPEFVPVFFCTDVPGHGIGHTAADKDGSVCAAWVRGALGEQERGW